MQQRHIGLFNVSAIGLGCMNLSHAYGTPPAKKVGKDLLFKPLEIALNQTVLNYP
jgi:hypothetical protein